MCHTCSVLENTLIAPFWAMFRVAESLSPWDDNLAEMFIKLHPSAPVPSAWGAIAFSVV